MRDFFVVASVVFWWMVNEMGCVVVFQDFVWNNLVDWKYFVFIDFSFNILDGNGVFINIDDIESIIELLYVVLLNEVVLVGFEVY